jgi:hypothetical protein
MLDETSNMPEYQWKLTIVERNLLLSHWMKLIPEAQEQMLWEADGLMGDLPLPDRQRLLISLETLKEHTQGDLQRIIQQILSNHSSMDIRKALELSIQNTTFSTVAVGLD